ncbi:MAG: HTH domain-containing protein [Nitrososphaeraceae archaeon]
MQSQKIKYEIISREERRRQVAQSIQHSLTEAEIAQKLGVNLATVYRDIEHLKQVANQFVYQLAKADLAYFYKDILDDLKKARLKAWTIHNNCTDSQRRDKLHALKVIIASNESMFSILSQGPIIMQLKALEERLAKIESSR